MYGKIASVRLELGKQVNSNATGTPLCRTMCGEKGNECVRMWVEREKVAAGNEGFAFVAILYTGVTDNKCGLSLAQRRALFVGIMNSIDKGYNPLVYCSTLRRGWIMPYAPLGLGAGIMAMPAMTACVGYLHIGISHKGVLSANAMSKVLAEICIPVKGVANRCVCLSLLPKRALLRCIDMKMCEYEGR